MIHIFQNALLFLAKVLDNAIGTSKTIMIQRSRWLLAGLTAFMSDFIYFWITKKALLKLPCIVKDILQDFYKLETGYMDTIRDCISGRADKMIQLEKQREEAR